MAEGIEEIITGAGYKFSRTCYCDGYKTKVFVMKDMELRWRLAKYTFRIKRYGQSLTGWLNLNELESKILETTI